jgi:DNA-binding response OmpR family regulator
VGNRDVIIADDDGMIRDIVRSLLDRAGFTVLQAKDGYEAIDCARRTYARLVILDYRMPRLNGFATCGEIRALPGYAAVPIAMLTAFDDEDMRAASVRAGATAFIGKPFTPVELLSAVADLLDPTGCSAMPTGLAEPRALIWQPRPEPRPLFGEPRSLAEGRRVLRLFRG